MPRMESRQLLYYRSSVPGKEGGGHSSGASFMRTKDLRYLIVAFSRPTRVHISGVCLSAVIDCGRINWMRERKSLSLTDEDGEYHPSA